MAIGGVMMMAPQLTSLSREEWHVISAVVGFLFLIFGLVTVFAGGKPNA